MFRFDRRLLINFDWVMLITVLVIAILGLLNLYSATCSRDLPGVGYHVKQAYYYILGFMVIATIISIDYHKFLEYSYLFYVLIIILLLSALLFGSSIANTTRWINLGFFKLQPSEPAKLMMVITLASYYYRKDTGKGFSLKELSVPAALAGLPFFLILKQPDLGTGLMLAFVAVSMTLFAKIRLSALLILICLGLITIPIGWNFVLKPYQKQRINTFLHPENAPKGSGYHIKQSKIAVGSGLTLGKGFLKGTQGHLDFLPERHTDFAFSVWAEEWGFVGSLFFLACYFFMILWGLNIALTARDKFGVLMAFGIVSLIFWQAIINLSMVMGLLPVVGMPLPLFSYGGSSLLTTLAGIGILINIRMRRFMYEQ
jgi:rod shape determining protein RodA